MLISENAPPTSQFPIKCLFYSCAFKERYVRGVAVVLISEGGNEGSRSANSVLKMGVSYSPQLGRFELLDGLSCFACT